LRKFNDGDSSLGLEAIVPNVPEERKKEKVIKEEKGDIRSEEKIMKKEVDEGKNSRKKVENGW
jgi:hypothetical protein